MSPVFPLAPADNSSAVMGRVRASTMRGQRTSLVLRMSSSSVCDAKAPGYSATRMTRTPLLSAVYFAWSVKPGPAIMTDGMPRSSAAMHEPVSFGVQSPHPPFPEITASTCIWRSFAWNSSLAFLVTPGAGYGPAKPISSRSITLALG